MRQICIDTETTGFSPHLGDRIIEVAAVEIVDRRPTGKFFHAVLDPEREISAGASKVHGMLWADMKGQHPAFRDVAMDFVDFCDGAEWIIHNASFDIGFLDHELTLAGFGLSSTVHKGVLDTMKLARQMGIQKKGLDALCDRYSISRSGRVVHGALTDAQLLAAVYSAMTAGQMDLAVPVPSRMEVLAPAAPAAPGIVILPTAEELAEHAAYMAEMEKAFGKCVWTQTYPIAA